MDTSRVCYPRATTGTPCHLRVLKTFFLISRRVLFCSFSNIPDLLDRILFPIHFFSFYSHTYGIQNFPSQGSNLSCSRQPTPQPQQDCQIQGASATYTKALGNVGSSAHWARPGIQPASSQTLFWVLNPLSHKGNSDRVLLLFLPCFPCICLFRSLRGLNMLLESPDDDSVVWSSLPFNSAGGFICWHQFIQNAPSQAVEFRMVGSFSGAFAYDKPALPCSRVTEVFIPLKALKRITSRRPCLMLISCLGAPWPCW